MSQTYIAQIVLVLALILPKFGIHAGSDELTALLQGAFVVGSILWTLIRRYQAGGVTPLGVRKA